MNSLMKDKEQLLIYKFENQGHFSQENIIKNTQILNSMNKDFDDNLRIEYLKTIRKKYIFKFIFLFLLFLI